MYNRIGLQTPRGSGTSGYVTANRSIVRPMRSRVEFLKEMRRLKENVRQPDAAPDEEILRHNQKRSIHQYCEELREELVQSGREEEEVEKEIEGIREGMLAKWEKGQLDVDLTTVETNDHILAANMLKERQKLEQAFQIRGDYQPGDAFDFEAQETKRLERQIAREEREMQDLRRRARLEEVKEDKEGKEAGEEKEVIAGTGSEPKNRASSQQNDSGRPPAREKGELFVKRDHHSPKRHEEKHSLRISPKVQTRYPDRRERQEDDRRRDRLDQKRDEKRDERHRNSPPRHLDDPESRNRGERSRNQEDKRFGHHELPRAPVRSRFQDEREEKNERREEPSRRSPSRRHEEPRSRFQDTPQTTLGKRSRFDDPRDSLSNFPRDYGENVKNRSPKRPQGPSTAPFQTQPERDFRELPKDHSDGEGNRRSKNDRGRRFSPKRNEPKIEKSRFERIPQPQEFVSRDQGDRKSHPSHRSPRLEVLSPPRQPEAMERIDYNQPISRSPLEPLIDSRPAPPPPDHSDSESSLEEEGRRSHRHSRFQSDRRGNRNDSRYSNKRRH